MNALTGNVPSFVGNPVRDGISVEKRAPPVFSRSGNPVRDDISVEDIAVEYISHSGNNINKKIMNVLKFSIILSAISIKKSKKS
jgi:hypothetical protein